ncbi:hypothetical protein DFH09DRAFT_1283262 [Mycena vulgaris]|nr:hypothetical protein DFH09DRAFT_1283262 [Mycena vulgaris]
MKRALRGPQEASFQRSRRVEGIVISPRQWYPEVIGVVVAQRLATKTTHCCGDGAGARRVSGERADGAALRAGIQHVCKGRERDGEWDAPSYDDGFTPLRAGVPALRRSGAGASRGTNGDHADGVALRVVHVDVVHVDEVRRARWGESVGIGDAAVWWSTHEAGVHELDGGESGPGLAKHEVPELCIDGEREGEVEDERVIRARGTLGGLRARAEGESAFEGGLDSGGRRQGGR